MWFSRLAAIFGLTLHYSSVISILVNTTIDDRYGDPLTGFLVTYAPAANWKDGPTCNGCAARLDSSQAYNGTWHDGTYYPLGASSGTPNAIMSASVSFNGSAVYVYCAVAHTATDPDGNMDMQFLIDGHNVGQFSLAPNGETSYDYNVPVFVDSQLPAGPHTLSIESGHLGQKALVLLDYIVYSHEEEEVTRLAPSQGTDTFCKKHTGTTVIIIWVVVTVAVITLVLLAAFLWTRRLKRQLAAQQLKAENPPHSGDTVYARFPSVTVQPLNMAESSVASPSDSYIMADGHYITHAPATPAADPYMILGNAGEFRRTWGEVPARLGKTPPPEYGR